VALQRGWNKVLVKAPKGERTRKWMFTFVPVEATGGGVREAEGLRFAASPSGK